MWKKMITNLGLPVLLILVSLAFEYHSGWFLEDSRLRATFNATLCLTFSMLVFAFFATDAQLTWLRPRLHVREDYSLLAFGAMASLTGTGILVILTGIMPWYLAQAFLNAAKQSKDLVPDPRFSDYALFILGYSALYATFSNQAKRWKGERSVQQIQREQKGGDSNFLIEGAYELGRILKRHSELERYKEDPASKYISQLDVNTDVLGWTDEARELVRLSSSIYSIDNAQGWHDIPGCWEGQNIKTGDLVFVFPTADEPEENRVEEYVNYAQRIGKQRKRRVAEIIVASYHHHSKKKSTRAKVRFVARDTLLDTLVDFRDYENEIRRRVDATPLPDSTYSIRDVYVPSKLSTSEVVEDVIGSWLRERTMRQIALLGEYGQGKSTTALMLTYHLLTVKSDDSKRTPILIELRGMSPRNLTPLQLLGAWSSRYRIDPQSLMRLLVAGRLLLIFEGFDEMSLVGDSEMRLQHFKTLWQFCYPNSKIIITGRPNFFLDEREMKAALGIEAPRVNQPYCESIRLLPFGLNEVGAALRGQSPSIRNQICELAAHNPRFLELVSRPSLLHIVSVLWERENLSSKVDQLNSAFVMDLFIRHSYRRQGLKELDSPDFMALTSAEREYFMRGIAASMAANYLPNQISAVMLNQTIEQLIEVIPDSVTAQAATISGETRFPLRLRLVEAENALEHVKTDVRVCGLLVDDPATPGTFRFGHKSFMEYLAASVVADVIREDRLSGASAILKVTGLEVSNVFELPVAVDFLAEILRTAESYGSQTQGTASKDYSVLRRLFVVISGGTRLSRLMDRVFLFNYAYVATSRQYGLATRILLVIFSPLGFAGWLMCLLIFMKSHRSSTGFVTADKYFLSLACLVALFVLALRPRRAKMRQAHLLNWMSSKLGIAHPTLHRFTGTFLLPWARGKPFDYFMYFADTNPLENGESEGT